MSILFDDASLQYAEAASAVVLASAPIALSCWLYIDDLTVDQTLVSLANSSSENNYFAIAFLAERAEVSEIITVGDVISDTLSGLHFLLDSIATPYYVWLNTGSSTDPAPIGKTPIEVTVLAGSSAAQVAIDVQTAIDAEADFSATVYGDTVTVTNAVVGNVPNAIDSDTGFTVSTITQGRVATIEARVRDNAGTLEVSTSTGEVLANTWHHAVGMFDLDSSGMEIHAYLDGADDNPLLAGVAGYPIGLDRTAIGRLSKLTPLEYTSGRIAEVTIWDLTTFLSASEVGDLGIDKSSSLLVRTDEIRYFAPMYNNDDPVIDIMFHVNAVLGNAPVTADHPPVQTFEPETYQRFRSGPIEFNLGTEGQPPFTDLLFTHNAAWELIKRVSNDIGFQQNVQHNIIVINVASSISFGQVLGKTSTLNVAVETNVNFSQGMGPTTEESLSNSVTFGAEASRGEHAISDVLFTSEAVGEASKGTRNDILFGQSVSVLLDINPVAANSISFGQEVLGWISNPGCVLGGIQTISDTITLTCGAASVTLKNPSFGNSESVDVDRVMNVSLGGTTNYMRDLAWPESTTINILVENLKEVKAQEVSAFLLSCLGKLVTYTNYEGIVWEGVILNPSEALTEERLDRWTANIELIGTRP